MSFERQEQWDRRSLIEPELDEPRFEEGWSAIEDRLGEPQKGSRAPWVAAGLVAAAAAAVILWVGGSGPSPWVGTTLATADEAAEVQLPEGSVVDAEPQTELIRLHEGEREVRLALREGAATFEVVRNPERLFAVEAGDVQVRVVGTIFRVARVGERVQVSVDRGAVDVRRGDELVRLRAGEQWEGAAEADGEEPEVTAQPVPIEEPEPPARRARASGPSADELFAAAAEARRSGEAREAARLYGRLVQRFPRGDRAALASFELGRIRIDQLGDPRGAAAAFRKALALGGGPFAQEARARLVEAYDAAGNRAACQRSREAYLRRHPGGRYAVDVTGACE